MLKNKLLKIIRILIRLNWFLIKVKLQIPSIKKRIKQMSIITQKLEEMAAALQLAADEIAADLQALKDLLANAGTPEEVEAILQPIVDRLNALGQAQ